MLTLDVGKKQGSFSFSRNLWRFERKTRGSTPLTLLSINVDDVFRVLQVKNEV